MLEHIDKIELAFERVESLTILPERLVVDAFDNNQQRQVIDDAEKDSLLFLAREIKVATVALHELTEASHQAVTQ